MKKRDILYYTNWSVFPPPPPLAPPSFPRWNALLTLLVDENREKRGYLAKRPSDAPSSPSPSVVVPAGSLDQRFKHETTAKYATGKGR